MDNTKVELTPHEMSLMREFGITKSQVKAERGKFKKERIADVNFTGLTIHTIQSVFKDLPDDAVVDHLNKHPYWQYFIKYESFETDNEIAMRLVQEAATKKANEEKKKRMELELKQVSDKEYQLYQQLKRKYEGKKT